MKVVETQVVETQDLASLRGINQFVSLDFHINGHALTGTTKSETVFLKEN